MAPNTEVQRQRCFDLDLDVIAQVSATELVTTEPSSLSEFPKAQTRKPLKVSWGEVDLGCLLGGGSFSSVYHVDLYPKTKDPEEPTTHESSAFVNDPSDIEISGFALKKLNDHTVSRPEILDLVYEAKLLTKLTHKHIIRLHAVSSTFWQNPAAGFLILERLDETLDQRLSRWKCTMTKRGSGFLLFRRSQYRLLEQRDRITQAALGISRALEFLHANQIVFCDLKPANAGFNQAGQIKLFDFGLARPCFKNGKERRLTGLSGTARYMAPEVSQNKPYGLSADVHSFAILLWQICSLQKPYSNATSLHGLQHMVVKGKIRPWLGPIASPLIKQLLKDSWNPCPEARPTFVTIVKHLELESTDVGKESPVPSSA